MNQLLNKFQVDKYIYLKETLSTNQHATNLSSISNPNHNFCIYTFNQTEGKGQIGRKWFTGKAKNVAVSYVFNDLKIKVKDHFYLNMAVSLALKEIFWHLLPSKACYIKWPNDIYIEEKKIAGILIQNQIKSNTITKSIVGIGLNVNTISFSEDLPNPTSLLIEAIQKKEFSLIDVLEDLTNNICNILTRLKISPQSIKKEYVSNLFRLNELKYFKCDNRLFEGKILGVEDQGQLILDTNEGIKHFRFREISFEKLNESNNNNHR